MKYVGMPLDMWLLFGSSFQRNLAAVFGMEPPESKAVMKKAKQKYKQIITNLPAFEKGDRCTAAYPCQRRPLLRLWVQKENLK